jgi:two-component system sensor histidine kinase BaeS
MRIQNKLFAAFLLAGISLVALMFFLMQWSLTKGLLEFINTKERDNIAPFVEVLKNRYQQENSWDWIDDRHRLFHDLFRDNTVDKKPHFGRGPSEHRRPPQLGEGRERFDDSRPPRRAQGNDEHEDRRPPPRGGDYTKDDSRRGIDNGPGHRTINRPANRRNDRPTDLSLFDDNKKFLVGRPQAKENDQWLPIMVEKQITGYLVIPRRLGITAGYELTLLEQQRTAFIIISLLLIGLTILIAMPLARNLVDPIKRLAQGMNQLTKGDYKSRVTLERNDELGNLSRDVNELAMTLEKNDSARRRWIADISHELRTPISIMKGEMEAVIDGVRSLDLAHVSSSHQEVQRLQRLVEDLYELTSADIGGMKYRKEEFDLVELIYDELSQFQQILSQSNIQLSHQLPEQPMIIWADADRLCQLFNNIMVNCAKYVDTDSETQSEIGSETKGQVNLTLKGEDGGLILTIEDNGKGVPEQHLANLFERLYRVDDSRNRKTGGSGLGLAICKQIVEAHRGTISAEKSALGGLAVVIEFTTV